MARKQKIRIEYSDPEQIYTLLEKLLHRSDVKSEVKREIRTLLSQRTTADSSQTALEGTAALHALYWTYR